MTPAHSKPIDNELKKGEGRKEKGEEAVVSQTSGSRLPAPGSHPKPLLEPVMPAPDPTAVRVNDLKKETLPERPDEEMDRELRSIYDEGGAARPDMKHLVRVRRSIGKRLLVAAIFFFAFLAAVSWTGYFLFSPADRKFSGEGVEVTIDGLFNAKSGETATYTIRWRNGEKVPLGTASLELRLPAEFAVTRVEPTTENASWNIGSVAPGKKGSVTVEGVFIAPVGKQADIQAILNYRPADFNSSFQKVATRAVSVTDSVLDILASGPPKVMPGDKVTLDFSYVNSSPRDFTGVRLMLAYPPGTFIPESAEPAAADPSQTVWEIGTVAANSENHVRVTGTFAAGAQGDAGIAARLGFADENGEFRLQKETVLTVNVVSGQLLTALILNGKSGDQPISLGATLRYAISWQNTGESDLEDVALSLVFEASPDAAKLIKWNELKDAQAGVHNGNRITWNGKQITALKKIGPNQEGTINIELPLAAEPPAGGASDLRITTWAETSIKSIDGEPADRQTKTTPFAAVVLSDAALANEARYFTDDGMPVGSGPLPPKVGEETRYRVYWKLSNSMHELGDLKLSARLPSNVVYTGKSGTDAGELKFDAAEEKVVWTLNWLPVTVKTVGIWFEIAITPTADQTDRTPTLTDAAIFEAKDRTAGFDIILSAPPLSTALENDEQAAGKGRVVQ